jgi:hypothetical protein
MDGANGGQSRRANSLSQPDAYTKLVDRQAYARRCGPVTGDFFTRMDVAAYHRGHHDHGVRDVLVELLTLGGGA